MADPNEAMYDLERSQTGGQWAVRFHGAVVGGLLLLAVPLFHLAWHVVGGRADPLVRTRSQSVAAPFERHGFLSGTWAQGLERQLREASPVVWGLRGTWNELRYLAGVYQSSACYANPRGWFFLRESLWPDPAELDLHAAARARFLREVRARCDELGVRLVARIIPDKARVHPEEAYVDGLLPAAKADQYPRLCAEFAAAGIPTVDLWGALAVARAADPRAELYFRRDTHWRPSGALFSAQATAAMLERELGAEALGPREAFELGPAQSVRAIPDLVSMGGFLAFDIDAGFDDPLTVPASPLTTMLAESADYYGLGIRGPGGLVGLSDEALGEGARVLLAGTSFAAVNGWRALALALGRRVAAETANGAGGLDSLNRALQRVAEQPGSFRVLIWEIVERGFHEAVWRSPRLPQR